MCECAPGIVVPLQLIVVFLRERDLGRVCWWHWHMFHYIFSFPFVSFQCAPHACKKHENKSILICESAYFPTRAGVGLGKASGKRSFSV